MPEFRSGYGALIIRQTIQREVNFDIYYIFELEKNE